MDAGTMTAAALTLALAAGAAAGGRSLGQVRVRPPVTVRPSVLVGLLSSAAVIAATVLLVSGYPCRGTPGAGRSRVTVMLLALPAVAMTVQAVRKWG